MKGESQHIDFVKHDWHGLKETLIERLPADDPRAGKHGDYAHYSEPHSMKDCPFGESRESVVALRDLREQAESHASFTRSLHAPFQGPWKTYWREAAIDLQRMLDTALDELEAALTTEQKP